MEKPSSALHHATAEWVQKRIREMNPQLQVRVLLIRISTGAPSHMEEFCTEWVLEIRHSVTGQFVLIGILDAGNCVFSKVSISGIVDQVCLLKNWV